MRKLFLSLQHTIPTIQKQSFNNFQYSRIISNIFQMKKLVNSMLPKSGWRKYVTFFENFEVLVFFSSGKQVLFLQKVLAKNYKGNFFSREACAIKFPLWKQYCNWKSEYGKYVFDIRPLSRFTLTCFHYPDFHIQLLPFSRI